MGVNSVPISSRNAPYAPAITAGGGYTLPQFAFIPNPVLHQLQSGMVPSPTLDGQLGGMFAAPPGIGQRPYPVPSANGAWSIRSATFKAGPIG
jgi:hypothetical protein